MKAASIVFAGLLLLTFQSLGQQESQFIQAINNPYMLNPSAAGLSDVMQFEASSRTQWIGYNGPQTFLLTGNSRIRMKKGGDAVLSEFNVEDKALFASPTVNTGSLKHIVGGRVLNDAIGPFSKTSLYGSYAIHLPFTKKMNFGAGLGIGWSNFRIVQDRVVLYETEDAAYSQFLGNSTGQNILDANAGIVFYDAHFVVGISTTQLFKNKAKFDNINTESFYNRHYFFTASYRFDFENKLGLEPSAVLKLVQKSPASLDLGLRLSYNRSAWLGLQYRTSNAITLQVGANVIKNLYVAYGYEIGTGKIRSSSNGTHEVQLGMYIGRNRNMNKEIEGKKEKHPGH